MSKLDKLIKKLCPNGVEFYQLGDIIEFRNGKGHEKNIVDNGKYIVVNSKFISTNGETKKYSNKQISALYINDILMVMSDLPNGRALAKCFLVTENDKYTLNQRICALKVKEIQKMNPKFLYYYLTRNKQLLRYDNGVDQTNLKKENILKIDVAVPPLEIQNEIVHILDNFIELKEKLLTELKSRQKQYDYYFDKILNQNKYSKMKLGDIGQVKMCKRILKSQTNNIRGVPFYKIGTFGKKSDAYIDDETFNEYKTKYSYPKKGDILISCSGTIGRTVIFDGEPAYFQDSNIVWLEHDNTKILNEYLFYCYKTNPWKISTGGTIARLYNENILKAEISVPPIETQKEIVKKLNKWYNLINDISLGLPAEIKARQKQYEYYRDKLLTFNRRK